MVETTQKKLDKDDEAGNSPKAPDGGWGWAVVFGAMVLNFLIGGAVNTFGVLYVALLDKFHQSAGATAWVGSMANAMGLLLGPMSSALSTRYSCRRMVIIGGLITAAGWAITGFMPRIEYMFLTYGVLAGMGKSISYTPSIVIVGKWFDRRRALANGISVSGAGLGTFAFAPLLETLLKSYGFMYTMIIMSGVMLTISACGFLFRPVPDQRHETPQPSPNLHNRNSCEGDNKSISCIDIDNDSRHKTEFESKNEEAKSLKDYLDYTLLKNPKFFCFGISVMFATLGHSPASVMLPSLAKQHHVAPEKVAFLLSVTGITDIIGRLLFGALCDIKALKDKRKYMYVASIFISGIANITCGFADAYWHFVTYSLIFGLFAGSYNALTPVILVDLLGAEKLSSLFGLALLFQGMGFLIGPPSAGWIADGAGNFQSAFFFAGIMMITGSIVMNIPSLCHKRKGQLSTLETRGDKYTEHSKTIDNYYKIYDNPAFANYDEVGNISTHIDIDKETTISKTDEENANIEIQQSPIGFINVRF